MRPPHLIQAICFSSFLLLEMGLVVRAFQLSSFASSTTHPPPRTLTLAITTSSGSYITAKSTTTITTRRERLSQLRAISNDEGRVEDDDGDEVYDITQNLFPEGKTLSTSSAYSAFAPKEKSEMNDRRPPSSISKRSISRTTATEAVVPPSSRTSDDTSKRKVVEATNDTNSRASALYKKIQSERQQQQKQAQAKPKKKIKQKLEAYYDITQSSFPERKSSFASKEKSEMNDRTYPSIYEERRERLAPGWSCQRQKEQGSGSKEEEEENFLDDMSSKFANERPSSLVNTGTKKRVTTSGTYEESKRRHKANNDNDDDEAFVDITRQHFGDNRRAFMQRVNTGTLSRRGTTAGQSTAASYRDVAHNFSPDRASLLGHPVRKKIDGSDPTFSKFKRRGSGSRNDDGRNTDEGASRDDANEYLDEHKFSSNLHPSSPVSASATSAVWRGAGDSPLPSPSSSAQQKERNEEKYLDTPRAFSKNLDMIPATVKGAPEVDKYLDTNSFSWNLPSPSSPGTSPPINSNSSGKRTEPPAQQKEKDDPLQYLDKPRPFRSNVDMVSSNFSGKNFKRSSDIPPEEKNVRDYYDITQAPLTEIDGTTNDRVLRRKRGSSRSGGGGLQQDEEAFDITRASFSRLERTSSVTKDANNASKVRRQSDNSLGTDSTSHQNDLSSSASASSYEEIMHWLLTHLPTLNEDDAITYFNQLLEDGFDNVEILEEQLMEDDLMFMKTGHRRALLRSVREMLLLMDKENDVGVEEEEEEDEDSSVGSDEADGQDVLSTDLEASTLDEHDGKSNQQNEIYEEEEEYEDITRSNFVDRPSLSSAATAAAVPSSLLPDMVAGKNKRQSATPLPRGDDEPEEEVFDITRDAFGDHRPSLAAAPEHHEHSSEKRIISNSPKDEDRLTTASVPEHISEPTQQSQMEEPIEAEGSSTKSASAAAYTTTAPRAELYQYYVNRGFINANEQGSGGGLKEYFTAWTNGAKSHESKFTCVFTCPLSGEHFACGNWGEVGAEMDDGVCWFKTKKQAMNAAAARALDCFSLRGNGEAETRRCKDTPYLLASEAPALPTLPDGISLPSAIAQPDVDSS